MISRAEAVSTEIAVVRTHHAMLLAVSAETLLDAPLGLYITP